jgi:glutamate-1-semialdehyde 2,1-aminomutase
MQMIAPAGTVYQAGTLSGNPLAMAGGIATLRELSLDSYAQLERMGEKMEQGLRKNAEEAGIPYHINRVGSMVCLFFTNEKVMSYDEAKTADTDLFAKYYRNMLAEGVLLPPSQFEGMFVSLAHSEEDIDHTLEANRKALKNI